MRVVTVVVLAAALAGCDVVFDLDTDVRAPDAAPIVEDLDQDGVLDDEDLCLAPTVEAGLDYDNDGIANGDDACPSNVARIDNDSDGDTIEDSCDPRSNLTGDRYRCVMVFSDPIFSSALWHPRADEKAWASAVGSLEAGSTEVATALATRNLEGAKETTYYAVLKFTLTDTGNATLWMRASATAASAEDLGCRFDTTSGSKVQIVSGTQVLASKDVTTTPSIEPHGNILRLRAMFTTSGGATAATCIVATNGLAYEVVTATAPLPPTGRAGVSVLRWPTRLELFAIYDRP